MPTFKLNEYASYFTIFSGSPNLHNWKTTLNSNYILTYILWKIWETSSLSTPRKVSLKKYYTSYFIVLCVNLNIVRLNMVVLNALILNWFEMGKIYFINYYIHYSKLNVSLIFETFRFIYRSLSISIACISSTKRQSTHHQSYCQRKSR